MSATDPEKAEASISNGPNARPRNEAIGQSAGGVPDDAGRPIDVSEEEAARIEETILGEKGDQPKR